MDRMFRLMFLLPLAFLAVTARAADSPQQVLRDDYACTLSQHGLLKDYHLYASDPKDKTLIANLSQSRLTATDCIRQLVAALGALGLSAPSAELSSHFSQFDKALSYNLSSIAKTGLVENEVNQEMVLHELAVVATLVKTVKDLRAAGKLKVAPEATQARDLAVMMTYTNARYVERTTQPFPREYNNEPTIDELANRFGKGLATLQASPRLTPELRKKVAIITTKFRFIRGSLQNYNEKTVPFTVDRHAKAITILLMEMADTLEPLK